MTEAADSCEPFWAGGSKTVITCDSDLLDCIEQPNPLYLSLEGEFT